MLTRFAVLTLFAAVTGCGGGTIRLADGDDSSSDEPVTLAPAPESWTEPPPSQPEDSSTDSLSLATGSQAETPSQAADTMEMSPQGYAPYQSSEDPTGDAELRRIGQWTRTGIAESRRLVIRNANQWAEFWAELGVGDRPEVDFARNTVVAVASGQRPSGGYEIAIERVRQNGGELTVEVVETAPAPNCMTSSALTQPVDVVVVPGVEARGWSFIERKEFRGCR